MKKITILVVFLIVAGSVTFAQGIYFKAGAGYGIPMASQVIGQETLEEEDYTNGNSMYSNSTENVSGSFGAGINFNVGAGYMFNEFLGAELNVQYTLGKKFETSDIETYASDGYTSSQRTTVKNYSNAIYLNPSFILTTDLGGKAPYGRFGVIIGTPTVRGDEKFVSENSFYPPVMNTRKWEYSKGMSIGFQGAVGMNWKLANQLDLFTEINFISMTYYAEEYNLTESNYNGTDQLQYMSVSSKKTIFKKELDLTNQQDPEQPSQQLREGRAFSSISLLVGIKFSLSNN